MEKFHAKITPLSWWNFQRHSLHRGDQIDFFGFHFPRMPLPLIFPPQVPIATPGEEPEDPVCIPATRAHPQQPGSASKVREGFKNVFAESIRPFAPPLSRCGFLLAELYGFGGYPPFFRKILLTIGIPGNDMDCAAGGVRLNNTFSN